MGVILKKLFFKKIIIIFWGFLFFSPVFSIQASEVWTLYFSTIKGSEIEIYCYVAKSDREKERGLMFREDLKNDECMIFVYDKPAILRFWMKNTLIPLSIGFIDSNLTLSEVFNMKPKDESIVSSTTEALYAVEVNLGWFKKNFVLHGSKLRIVPGDMRIKKK